MSDEPARAEHLARWDTIDGSRWHVIEEIEERETAAGSEEVYRAICGASARWMDVQMEAPADSDPEDLTGTTICYNCANARMER